METLVTLPQSLEVANHPSYGVFEALPYVDTHDALVGKQTETVYRLVEKGMAALDQQSSNDLEQRLLEDKNNEQKEEYSGSRYYKTLSELNIVDKVEIYGLAYENFREIALGEGSERRLEAERAVEDSDEYLESIGEDSKRTIHSAVCIPVAIKDEPVASILKTFEALAQQEGIDAAEIILWANYPVDATDSVAVRTKYEEILITISDLYPKLRVRPTLKGYPKDILKQDSMMRIRSDYMDTLIYRTERGDIQQDAQVLWLDSDTISMSRGSVAKLFATAKEAPVFAVKPNLRYTDQTYKAKKDHDLTNPHDVAALDELARRTATLNILNDYVEECGLAFRLDNYVLSGGVQATGNNTKVFGGESASMESGLYKVLAKGLNFGPIDEKGHTELGLEVRDFIFDVGYFTSVVQESSARIYTDARRTVNNVIKKGHEELDNLAGVRQDYQMDRFHDETYRGGIPDSIESIPISIGATILKSAVFQYIPRNNVKDLIEHAIDTAEL